MIRWRKSIRIAPGVRINLGRRSSSVSLGPTGAHLTVGTHGTRAGASLPGTGLSVSEPISVDRSTGAGCAPWALAALVLLLLALIYALR